MPDQSTCARCGLSIDLPAWRLARGARYCSRACCDADRKRSVEHRFVKRFNAIFKSDGCWEWPGQRTSGGYGTLRKGGRDQSTAYSHRLSYTINIGPIPEGMVVCHRCDNPPCCRPDHLFLGTQAENVADKIAKGRQPRPQSAIPTPRVNGIAAALLAKDQTQETIATAFGVSVRTVARVAATLKAGNGGRAQPLQPWRLFSSHLQ